jgi:HPr kinase/phosphorylase
VGEVSERERPYALQVHGALVEVLGLGVLLLGQSGVGKSECALQLVQRGHRLVADDVVRLHVESGPPPHLVGRAPALIRHYMELRGIGLVSILDLYGASAVREQSRVDLVCRLEFWREGGSYERVGLDRPMEKILDVSLPALTLPLRPSISMAALVEVAVRDDKQRRRGVNAAERLDAALRSEATASGRGGEPGP